MKERFDELLAGYLEGALSPSEAAELAGMVERDEELRRKFLDLAGTDGLLRARLGPAGVAEELLGRISLCLVGKDQEDRTAESVMERIEAARSNTPRRLRAIRHRRWGRPGTPSSYWGIAAAVPAVFLIVIIATVLNQKPPSSPPPTAQGPRIAPPPPIAPMPPPAAQEPEAPQSEPPQPAPPPPPAPPAESPAPLPVPAPPPAPAPMPEPPNPVPRPITTVAMIARLEGLSGTVQLLTEAGRRPARAGQEVASGWGLETSEASSVALLFVDGTRVEVAEGASVRELADRPGAGKSLFVDRGAIAADVRRQPEGQAMTFVTAQAEARVLGTRLTVAAEAGSTSVAVAEGRVQVTRREDGASVVVAADHYATVMKGLALAAKPLLAVTGFTLINADSDQPIAGFDPIKDGATINLAKLPTRNINIRANASPPAVGCVQFALDSNPNLNTEREAPYALQSSSLGDFSPWPAPLGTHTLTATPWSGPPAPGKRGGTGTAGKPFTIRFTVIDRK